MRVRWTVDAADDLERICNFISGIDVDLARHVASQIVSGAGSLAAFPHRGRPGRVDGTRELVLAPLPFLVVYEVHDEVHVLRVLHGAQRWPLA